MYKKGTIILTPFPFTDLSSVKVRPAIILHSERSNDDVIVVFITTTEKKNNFTVNILPSMQNGLKVKSKIICTKIIAIDKKIILGELGTCEKPYLQEITTKLKTIFEI